ncbi:MAG: hypothetical protein AAFZ01_04310 [Pseudomonadota bacterium]
MANINNTLRFTIMSLMRRWPIAMLFLFLSAGYSLWNPLEIATSTTPSAMILDSVIEALWISILAYAIHENVFDFFELKPLKTVRSFLIFFVRSLVLSVASLMVIMPLILSMESYESMPTIIIALHLLALLVSITVLFSLYAKFGTWLPASIVEVRSSISDAWRRGRETSSRAFRSLLWVLISVFLPALIAMVLVSNLYLSHIDEFSTDDLSIFEDIVLNVCVGVIMAADAVIFSRAYLVAEGVIKHQAQPDVA